MEQSFATHRFDADRQVMQLLTQHESLVFSFLLNLALYDLSKLRGHLILVHGRTDPLVPYSESQALAAAATKAQVSLFLVDEIGHVDFNAVTAANAVKIWQAVDLLLGKRR